MTYASFLENMAAKRRTMQVSMPAATVTAGQDQSWGKIIPEKLFGFSSFFLHPSAFILQHCQDWKNRLSSLTTRCLMKKIALLSALTLVLLACSVSDVTNILSPLFTPTPSHLATSTVYLTPSDTPTITATLPTPTFTDTPTLIGIGPSATPSLTETPTNAFTSSTGSGNTLSTPQYVGFTTIQVSGNILRWGKCEPASLTFTAHVVDPVAETTVLLFLRLKNQTTGETTKWGGGASMNGDKTGTFTYTLTVKNVSRYQDFPGAWLQYQLVATNGGTEHLGWTQPYLDSITISPCP
jgi:hypothetical protein